jgi:hypothetical protein
VLESIIQERTELGIIPKNAVARELPLCIKEQDRVKDSFGD